MQVPVQNKPSHLRALLKKNWILWKRSWFVSLLEIVIPVLLAIVMLGISKAIPSKAIPETTYINNPDMNIAYDGALGASDLQYIKDCNDPQLGGKIALAPSSDNIISQLNTILSGAGFSTELFADNQGIDEFIAQSNYGSEFNLRICFGVVMSKNNINSQYEYLLRFNVSEEPDSDLPNTLNSRIKYLAWEDNDSFDKYTKSGFLVMQNLLDNLILNQEIAPSTGQIQANIAPRSVRAHVENDVASNLVGFSRIFFDLPLRLPFLRFMNFILVEKEKRIREGMKIMGLKNTAFYLSWFITYTIIFTIISIITSAFLTAGLFPSSSYGFVFLWHWEYSLCLMMLGFFLSIFFNNAKRGVIAALVITVAIGFLQVVADEESSPGLYSGLSFIPPASFGLAADHILRLESAQVGLTSATVNQEIVNNKMTYHYRSMVIDFFIFLILGAYLDQVLPSEFGIRKSPLFFLKSIKRFFGIGKKSKIAHNEEIYKEEESDNFEKTPQILKAQDASKDSVQILGLQKVFGSKTAVNGVAFSMYKNQIFALLGHNGAGKTTTISMITGLIQPTAGTTKVFGKDINLELDEIRKSMGICPQHDVLFDNLTVKEHLELFAVFKGMNKKDIPQEVDKIIYDIGLSDKRNYLSKNLSGGQKRKLSVGIAFIGGSKFILLDEPSSGMDTFARRKLWDMLKNYKQERVILLTTHFMDEADYLGDRIGIMADGQLKCLGSSLFLKTRFGVGYSLTLIKKDINTVSKPIIQLIQEQVKSAKVTSDVSAELTLQLPLEESSQFQDLFNNLDLNLEKLGVSSYGLSVTTLEEVFLNVAKLTAKPALHQLHSPKDLPSEVEFAPNELKEKRVRNPWSLAAKQFAALTAKRYHYSKRDKKGLIIEFLIPIIIALIGINTANSKQSDNNDIISLPLSDNLYNYQFAVDYNSPVNPVFLADFNSNYFKMTPISTTSLAQFDQSILQSQGNNVLETQINVFNIYLENLDQSNHDYDYTALIDTRAQEGAPFALNKINNAVIKYATGNSAKQISVVVAPLPKTQKEKTTQNRISGIFYAFGFGLGLSFIAGSLIVYIVKEREANAKHQQIVSGASLPAYWFSNFFFDYLKYLVPAILCALIAIATDASALIDDGKIKAMWAIFLLYGLTLIPFTYLTSFLFRNYGSAQVTSFFFNFATGFIAGVSVGMLRTLEGTHGVALILQWILRPLPTFAMTYGFFNLANREVYFILGTEKEILDVFDIRLAGGDILFLVLGAIIYTLLLFAVENLKNTKSLSRGGAKVPYIPKKLDDDVEREMGEVAASDNKTYSIKVDKLRKVYALGKGKHKVAVDKLSFGVKNGECFALLGVNGAGKTTTFKMLSGDVIQTSGDAYINGFEIPKKLNEARHDIGYCPQFDALLDNLTAKEHLYLFAALKGIPSFMIEKCVQSQLVQMNLKKYENSLAGTYSGGNKRKLSVAIAMIGDPSVVFLDEPSTGMDPEARRFMWNVISRISKERKQSSVILTTHSMEEAEALATKMGIMVNGNLKCLGTSQHIKNKFGGGYEVEVKLNLPTKTQINQTIESLGLTKDSKIDRNDFEEILNKLGAAHLKGDNGTSSNYLSGLEQSQITVDSAVEWILTELDGQNLKMFLSENFGEMKLLENFQAFYRFKSDNKISISKFFGALEENKNKLNILQYSICQSTIEQIFNRFAAEQDMQEENHHVNLDIPNSKETVNL